MKSNGVGRYICLAALGFIMLVSGLLATKSWSEAVGVMRGLPYILIGVGAGIFGSNLGTAIKNTILRKDPQAAKEVEINTNDERNIAIGSKAKSKAYDLMLMVYGALMLAFALMQVDMFVILAFVAAYLFVVFSMIYYLSKYQKEM